MPKLLLHFLFLIVCLSLVSETAKAVTYKTQNLKYDIKIDIPTEWRILPKNTLQAASMIPNMQFLLMADDGTHDNSYFHISIVNGSNLYTEEKLADLSLADFQSIREKAITDAMDWNKTQQLEEIDPSSIRIFIEKVDGVLALGKSSNRRFDNKNYIKTEYTIPLSYGDVSITFEYSINKEKYYSPIMDKIISSIKIGKTQLKIDEIETFLNTLKE